jgi:F-type H+-transporting ATPase subunit b
MGEILSQLGHLFVQSIPTVVFVFLLLVILERLFFRPLTTLLKQREEATRGAVARARAQVAAAEARTREYEAAFQTARQDVYRLREAERKTALGERENTLRKAREQSEALLKDAQAGLSRQVEAAKRELESSSRALGVEITEAILGEGKGGAAA